MRIIFSLIPVLALAACSPTEAQNAPETTISPDRVAVTPVIRVDPSAQPLVSAARDRLKKLVSYDGAYIGIDYPGGDVPAYMGVCTDVVIRSYRAAYGFDLQKVVHEDMRENFEAYPTNWGLSRPDKNIDHRRVPNLETWFTRAGYDIPISATPAVYQPGDIVSWRLDRGTGKGGLPHIGIVSERVSRRGTPLIIHNIGRGPEESDILFDHTITGHFRYFPSR